VVAAVGASLLVVAVIWLIRPETELISIAYAEFSEVVENRKQAEWVHFVQGDREIWMSYRPFRYYEKSPGRVLGADRSTNRRYRYDAGQRTVTVSCLPLSAGSEIYGSFAGYIRMKIGRFEEIGDEVGKGTETLDGKVVTVYVVTGTRNAKKGSLKYYVDPQTDHVIKVEETSGWSKHGIDFDYPTEGPQSVYALGVPKDATVVDKTPTPEVLDLVAKVENAARAGTGRFYEVSVEVYESSPEVHGPDYGVSVEVTYCKDGQVRRDRYYEPCPKFENRQQAERYLEMLREQIPVDRLDMIEAWLSDRKPRQITLADKLSGRFTLHHLDAEGKLASTPLRSAVLAQGFACESWGLPIALDGTSALLTNSRGESGALKGIENRGGECQSERSYFNPDRDYLCEKHERVVSPDNIDSTEVLEYARTSGGQWFCRRLRKTIGSGKTGTVLVTNFRDDRRSIEPSVFDGRRITAQELSPR